MKKLMLTYQPGFNAEKLRMEQNNYFYKYKERMSNVICLIIGVTFLLLFTCESAQKTDRPSDQIPEIEPIILRTLSHDTLAFTQGLLYYEDKLYESTGRYDKSSLRRINTKDGKVEKLVPVVDSVFAEGLVINNNIFVQLTWRSGLAFLYSYPDLKRIDTLLKYEGEGWGLTSDGSSFIMSDGSNTLYWRDKHFNVFKEVPVTLNNSPLSKLNELEYARDRIYANVWYSDFIFEIEPESGRVLRIINCRSLLKNIQSVKSDEVLNGIAYNDSSDTFFLTGKNWPLIFEVRFP